MLGARSIREFGRFAGALRPLVAAVAVLVSALAAPTVSAGEQPPVEKRPLPFGADWARARGIDLPNPFGVSVFMVTMTRDIEVTDVRVSREDNEPVSVGDVASFAVRNTTTLAALKFDAWILPVLDLYALAGHSWTDSRLDAR